MKVRVHLDIWATIDVPGHIAPADVVRSVVIETEKRFAGSQGVLGGFLTIQEATLEENDGTVCHRMRGIEDELNISGTTSAGERFGRKRYLVDGVD